MYKYMVLARKFDERNLLLQRAGKINFHVSGIGQEACQVAAAFALDREKDYFLPYYRDYGFVLAVGMTPRELMLSALPRPRIRTAADGRCRATSAVNACGS